MINPFFQNYGIFTSGKPTDNDILSAYKQYKIKKIVSLDNIIGKEVSEQLKRLKLPIKHEIFNITPGSPVGEASELKNKINSVINEFPILIHCQKGADRTGFAVASWLIRNGKMDPCQAKETVEKVFGYGNFISNTAKNSLDKLLGCFDKELTPEKVKEQLDKNNVFDGKIIDNFTNDYKSNIGDGANYNWVWRSNFIDPDKEIYPTPVDYSNISNANIEINIIKRSNIRKKFLKKILRLNFPRVMQGVNSGQVDNYAGFANTFSNPSGSPGAPNAAAPVDSAGYIQI
jgi:hypothetical protein